MMKRVSSQWQKNNILRMKKALIISNSKNIGHLSSALAWYSLCMESGYEATLFTHERLRKYYDEKLYTSIKTVQLESNFDIVFFMSPAIENYQMIRQLKINKVIKIGYIFHEPLDHPSHWFINGIKNGIKSLTGGLFQCMCISKVNFILLPSSKAYALYHERWIYKKLCKTYHRFPLMFEDESVSFPKVSKEYFSYIGTVTNDHGFTEFLMLAKAIIQNNLLPEVKILIATKSDLADYNEEIKQLEKSDRVVISSGKIMSNEEINNFYNQSFLIWNGYNRSTQSGVLAKAYMFGTPVIYNKSNESEFHINEHNSIAVESNQNLPELINSIFKVFEKREEYSASAKKSFEEFYHYTNFRALFNTLFN